MCTMCEKCHQYKDLSLLILRLSIAAIFIYAGVMKFGMWNMDAATAGMSANMLLLMKVLAVVETLAGIAILLGICAETAAVVVSLIMVGAIYVTSQTMGMGFMTQTGPGWAFPLMILGGALVLATHGSGKYVLKMMCDTKK